MNVTRSIQVPAVQLTTPSGRQLFAFGIDGKRVPEFATISRIRRDDSGEIGGYQRPEVLSHIAEIRAYLETPAAMIPNAVVVAFNRSVQFTGLPQGSQGDGGSSVCGVLEIPCDADCDESGKPGFVVDGQQRLAAIRDAEIDGFPIFVVAFVARDIAEEREQFILVNSTRPLPKGLIYELLPDTQGLLPSFLRKRQFPALLAERLNRDLDSPLQGMIRRPTTPDGMIQDNSLLKFLENSLTDGVLYRCKADTAQPDDSMLPTVKNFWGAVRGVFAEAWGLPPKKSRLFHGAGVVSLGFLMDAVADRHRGDRVVSEGAFADDLKPLKPVCRWTDGYWDFGMGCQRKWNEIQNTPKDVQLLSNHLLLNYKALVWGPARGERSGASR
jgi:DGQHR domain-containing protein